MTEREDVPLCAGVEPIVFDESPASEETQIIPAQAASAPPALSGLADDEPDEFVPARVGCRTDLRGWAGAHLHGAVRPRRRAAGRGRPPGRWC